ncbi:MAG: hypothetical protein QG567_1246, partial [Campylobacterota bacterium]|nr:hypothetical protein [Campylobacterota bacterium]
VTIRYRHTILSNKNMIKARQIGKKNKTKARSIISTPMKLRLYT